MAEILVYLEEWEGARQAMIEETPGDGSRIVKRDRGP